ncbi:ATP-binding protein [Actinokineospora sp. NPDC004072]
MRNILIAGTAPEVVVQAHTVVLPAERPVPRQLPAAPAGFVGRDAELAELDRAAGAVVISALAGAGGIGKTWLALHWAHRNAERFPDGQLFVDLRGFAPGADPMPAAEAVRGFLDALGVDPRRLPPDPHAQVGLYRSLTAGKRLLVVLDNAASAEQVVPLLPGTPRATVLVTSRRRLTGLVAAHGALPVLLDALPDGDARRLLTARIGRERVDAEPAAAADLLAGCGGFPLALAVASGRARVHPRLPLAALAADLRRDGGFDGDDPATSLTAVLSWSHRGLTAEQRRVFGLLGVAPGRDIGLPAAAALTGIAVDRLRRVLDGLVDASLLDGDGRYRMHDLVRAYAATTAEDPAPALRRVLDFYAHTAVAADRLLIPHRKPIQLDPPAADPHPLPDAAAALSWLDAELANLVDAQRVSDDATAWRLAWGTSTFLFRRGQHDLMRVVWSAAVAAAEHLDATARMLAHRHLGLATAHCGDADAAVEHLQVALALADGQPDALAPIHQSLAWVWDRSGNAERALHHAQASLDLLREVDQPVARAAALNAAGWYAARCGNHDLARERCQAALALNRTHDNPGGAADALDSLGYIDHHSGRHRAAIEHYEQALALRRATGAASGAADILDHLGHPHTALGDHDRAREVWQEALRLYEAQGRDTDATRVRTQLADLSRKVTAQPSQGSKSTAAAAES